MTLTWTRPPIAFTGQQPEDHSPSSSSPLWSIALVVGTLLLLPALLYTLAPDEPLRPGVVVYSTDKHQVPFETQEVQPSRRGLCVLEPGEPLTILEPPDPHRDGLTIAQYEGRNTALPFCLPHARVTHQATLRLPKARAPAQPG